MNWYKKIYKQSYRGHIPKMLDWDERLSDPYGENPNSFQLTKPNPYFGGKTRVDYPDDYSFRDDDGGDYGLQSKLPSENVLMDQNPPTGEGANDDRFVSQQEKMPIQNTIDIGPHNMQTIVNLHDYISNKNKFKNKINKV